MGTGIPECFARAVIDLLGASWPAGEEQKRTKALVDIDLNKYPRRVAVQVPATLFGPH